MSTIYLLALIGVGAVLMAALLEAVWSVTRKPQWGPRRRTLSLVHTVDARTEKLSYVGADRRADDAAHGEGHADADRQAA